MANIFRVYKDSQVTADRIRAENAAARLDNAPERRLYVFGGADGTFPYFASFGSALTYANALTPAPSTSHPVSIVLLSKQNGDPEVITGNDDWYALCLDGIYVSSPYREIFSTTTLPTTLPKGMRVMYEDANGTESLWVGNAGGNAWPAVGYKEWRAIVSYPGEQAVPTTTVLLDTLGDVVPSINSTSVYQFSSAQITVGKTETSQTPYILLEDGVQFIIPPVSEGYVRVLLQTTTSFEPVDGGYENIPLFIRIYP